MLLIWANITAIIFSIITIAIYFLNGKKVENLKRINCYIIISVITMLSFISVGIIAINDHIVITATSFFIAALWIYQIKQILTLRMIIKGKNK